MRHALLLALIVSSIAIHAQDKTIDKRLKGLDEAVQKIMTDWKVQGLSIGIVEKGKVIYTRGYGFRDVESKQPVTPNTQFAIGSCTKAFTAATVCILKDDNIIDLDKPVKTYLPSLMLYDKYVSDNITPRDLLCHRSGLPRHDLVWYGSSASREEIFSRLKYLEPSKPFRTTYQYQNLMFMTAGYLVGKLTGTSWESFAQSRILDPIGMTSTNFSIAAMQKSADHSLGYSEWKNNVDVIPYMNIDAVGPAGSINSTAEDMSKWLKVLINGGKYNGKQILSASTIKEIQTPAMTLPAAVPIQYDEASYNNYGLGWTIASYRGHIRVEHGGNIDGFSASTCFMPRDSIGVVVLTNMNGTSSTAIVRNLIIDKMLSLPVVDWNGRLLADLKKAKDAADKAKKEVDANKVVGTKPSHALTDFTGKFEHQGYGIMAIAMNGDSLQADIHGLKTNLRHYHYDYFEATNERLFNHEKISFTTNLKGEVEKVSIRLEPAVDDIVFVRIVEPTILSADALMKFVGNYDFSGAIAKIYAKPGKGLFMSVPGQPEYELEAVKENEFNLKSLKGFAIRFTIDSSGNVTDLLSIQPNGTFKAKRV